jgi:hypothetical protein
LVMAAIVFIASLALAGRRLIRLEIAGETA